MIFFSSLSLAHQGGHDGLGTFNEDASLEGNHGAYGYAALAGEAASAEAFNFRCSDEELRRYASEFCNGTVVAPDVDLSGFMNNVMRGNVLREIQGRMAEYTALHIQESSPTAVNLRRPECIDEESPSWQRIKRNVVEGRLAAPPGALIFLPSGGVSLSTGPAPDPDVVRDFEAINGATEPDNMAQALAFSDRQTELMTSPDHAFQCNRRAFRDREECPALELGQWRIQNSYPALWTQSNMPTREVQSVRSTPAPHLDKFRETIHTLMGARRLVRQASGGRAALKAELRQARIRGRREYNRMKEGDSDRYTTWEDDLKEAISAGLDADDGSPLKEALNNFFKAAQVMGQGLQGRMRNDYNNVCQFFSEREDNRIIRTMLPRGGDRRTAPYPPDVTRRIAQERRDDLRTLMSRHPHVVRRAMMEMSTQNRALAKSFFCEDRDLLREVQQAQDCSRVSGGPLPGSEPVSINRWNVTDPPYGSDNNFTISRPTERDPDTGEATPYTASSTVHLIISDAVARRDCNGDGNNRNDDRDGDGINDCVKLDMLQRYDETERWLNCSTGQVPRFTPNPTSEVPNPRSRSCPMEFEDSAPNYASQMSRDPGLKFDINLSFRVQAQEEDAPIPEVAIHECFHSDVVGERWDKGDCSNVRELFINRCEDDQDNYLMENESSCQQAYTRYLTDEPGILNRENSGNMTFASTPGTVRHEMLHLFGLPDEYSSRSKPFNHLGPHNSIMNGSEFEDARLYPYHVDRILAPLNCPNVQGGAS